MEQARKTAEAPGAAPPTVLVVDDNTDMLELVGLLLTNAGFQVVTAEHPLQALEILEEKPPDAMVLDIMMPVRSGLEVLENIRWNTKLADLPVVVLTAASLRNNDRKFVDEFTRAYLDKTEINKLVPLLREILNVEAS